MEISNNNKRYKLFTIKLEIKLIKKCIDGNNIFTRREFYIKMKMIININIELYKIKNKLKIMI